MGVRSSLEPYDAGREGGVLSCDLGDGARLGLLEPWQAEEFAAHVESARAHLAPWVPFATRIVDVAAARDLLQHYADEQARDGGRLYGIWLGETLSGGTLFRSFDVASGVCEIGVWLAPSAQGRGLVTRAATTMIDWAIDVRGMSRIEWRTDPENSRSRAVARRLGMALEGVLRSSSTLNGTRQDMEVWSVLADEWRARRPVGSSAPQP
jgi:ribosomal-protein-serine acetyltransferase